MADIPDQMLFDITLNYEGVDVTCRVNYETANRVLNDADAARKYVEDILKLNPLESPDSDCHKLYEMTSTASGSCLSKDVSAGIWSSKSNKSTKDHEATLLFLQLRAKWSTQFDDKKSMKASLWQRIASEMNNAGYLVGEGKDGAEKCRQKFQNMQRTYHNHIKTMKRTGEAKKDPPLYFAEMHDILGTKDKTDPPYLEDSEQDLSVEQENSTTKADETSVDRIKSRFASGHTPLKPSNSTTRMLEQLREQHEEDKKQRDDQFRMLHAALDRQNNQRDRLLDLLEGTLTNKRKRSSSSGSDS